MIIAIDGYSSCGKSTLARELARELHMLYIDTGAMYRAATLYALRRGLVEQPERLVAELRSHTIGFGPGGETLLDGECVEADIRGLEVSNSVSRVSAIGPLRELLVGWQRDLAKGRDVCLDGRDIGTVVFPDADVKLFMTARPDVRARRRYDELRAKGESVRLDEVLANVLARDQADTTRAVSPLRQATDAVVIDNSDLTREQQLQRALDIVAGHR